MLQIHLFFGQERDGRTIPAREWGAFLEHAATPRFPLGFTVYDGNGQWRDSQTQAVAREKSKIMLIVAMDSPELRKKVEEVSRIYRDTFHQKAVGILTDESCAVF